MFIWLTLFACGSAHVAPTQPVSQAQEAPSATPPAAQPIASEPSAFVVAKVPPAPFTITGKATISVGDDIVVCGRKTPMFQPSAYACTTAIKAEDHSIEPTVTGKAVYDAALAAGLDPDKHRVTLIHYKAGNDPHNAPSSGMVVEAPKRGVGGLFTQYVMALSDGRKAIFLSQHVD